MRMERRGSGNGFRGECCERSGFRIWAWVRMGHHYHLLIKTPSETPSANLVAGIAWLQGPYARRFNAGHRQWRRLFGDRYKPGLIESGSRDEMGGDSYLQPLLDDSHLNPVQGGCRPNHSRG